MAQQINPTDHPYKILDIDSNATESEIKAAYFSKVREHPPEKDPAGFKQIRAAYEKLRNRDIKIQTDLLLIHDFGDKIDRSKLKFPDGKLPESSARKDLLAINA